MKEFSIGEIWWTSFPFDDVDETKHRPAIIIDDNRIAILVMYVTSQDKDNPFFIKIDQWQEAGLSKPSWARIDRIINIDEWRLDRKIGDLSEADLLKFLQLIAEFNSDTYHEFSLVAISRADDRFLQVYDQRWDSWLFPYFRSADDNRVNVDKEVSNLLHMDVETSYVAHANHCKYSNSDDVYKIYNHKLYKLALDPIPESMQADEFELDGKEYKWLSISEMEDDSDIMEVNDDVVAFVKKKLE